MLPPSGIDVRAIDDLARLDTPLHRLDARALALATAAYLLTVASFDRYAVAALTPLALFPVTLAAIGHLPAGTILRRSLSAAPFALGIAAFNPLFDKQPVALWEGFAVRGGWVSFCSILLRFALTVPAALVLLAGTGMPRLCAALERLRLPRVFVAQIWLLHRYAFLLSDQAERVHRAARLRAGGGLPTLNVFGSLLAQLLTRSLDRAERVHRAMRARGFDGRIRDPRPTRFRWPDALFLGGWVMFFMAARRWNLAAEIGRWLLQRAS